MKTDPDNDLRARFQEQRRRDHEDAPAWNPGSLHAPSKRTAVSWAKVVWLPACAAAVVTVGLLMLAAPEPQPRLSEALPVLLDAPGEPLFASLAASTSDSPSDFFLPAYLTIQMP